MRFGRGLWPPGAIVLGKTGLFGSRYALFRLGPVQDTPEPQLTEINEGNEKGWEPYEGNISIGYILAIYEDESEAIGVLKAILEHQEVLREFDVVKNGSVPDLIDDKITVEEIRKRSVFVKAVTMHLSGTAPGVTDIFVEETLPAMERLLARVALASD